MSDFYSLPSFFSDDPRSGGLTYEQLQQRRKLAMMLAARSRPHPKTIGEGLSVLGEGVGEWMNDRKLAAAEAQQKAKEEAVRGGLPPETNTFGTRPSAPAATPAPAPQASLEDDALKSAQGLTAYSSPELLQSAPSSGPAPPSNLPTTQQFRGMNASPLPLDPNAEAVQAQRLASLQSGTAPSAPSMSMDEWKQRIARNESGGKQNPYQAVGPVSRRGDYPYGKYQVMGENIPVWSKQYLGREMTPDQFLADPDAQEALADARGGEYVQKYGPQRAAAAWFAGEKGMNDPNRRDTLGTHVAGYVNRFNQPLDGRGAVAKQMVAQQAPQAAPMPQRPEGAEDEVLSDVTGFGQAAKPLTQLASLSNPMGNAMPPDVGARRQAIANSLSNQQAAVPPAAPLTTQPQAAGSVPPAQATAVPQQRIAQAPPPGTDPASALLGPMRPMPTAPDRREYGPTERENYARQQTTNPALSPETRRGYEVEAQRLQAIRDAAFNQKMEAFKIEKPEWLAEQARRQTHNLGDPVRQQEMQKRALEIRAAAEDEIISNRIGRQDKTVFFNNLRKEATTAEVSSKIMEDNRMILKALKDGVIMGPAANFRINAAKLAGWALENGYASEQAANSEIARALGGSRIREALAQINPTGVASNTDLYIARILSGAEPTMETKSFLQLLHKSNQYNARTVNDFEDKRDHYLGGTNAERDYKINTAPTAPSEYVQRLLEKKDDKAARAAYDDRFGEGAAALEIERAKRRSRRGE